MKSYNITGSWCLKNIFWVRVAKMKQKSMIIFLNWMTHKDEFLCGTDALGNSLTPLPHSFMLWLCVFCLEVFIWGEQYGIREICSCVWYIIKRKLCLTWHSLLPSPAASQRTWRDARKIQMGVAGWGGLAASHSRETNTERKKTWEQAKVHQRPPHYL